MLPTVFWMLVVLFSNGEGLQAGSYGNEAECRIDRLRALDDPNVVLISECVEIKLSAKS